MQSTKWSKILPWVFIFIGILLLIYMMTYEGEPGALPLLILLTGISWLIFNRFRK